MKVKVSIAMEKKLVERLDKIAAVSNASRSQIIEQMVRDEIESTEQLAVLMANPTARRALMQQFAQPGVLGPMVKAMGEDLTPELQAKMMEAMEQAGSAAQKTKEDAMKKGKGKKS